jgi:hypothetical protein
MRNKFLKATLAGLFLTVSGLTNAALIFNDLASFEAATDSGLTYESFEAGLPDSQSLTFGILTFSETNGINRVYNDSLVGATDGTRSVNIEDNSSSIFTLSFGSAINSFGAYFLSSQDISITFSGGASGSFSVPSSGSTFFGLLSPTNFSTISFDATGSSFYGVDELRYGLTEVPEPSTLAIFALGLMGLASRRFMKKS